MTNVRQALRARHGAGSTTLAPAFARLPASRWASVLLMVGSSLASLLLTGCPDTYDCDDCYYGCFEGGCVDPPQTGPEASCNNGVDDDGDGLFDCADPDCTNTVFCRPLENCFDGFDDDGDGLVDCADPDCAAQCPTVETSCFDGVDNDMDGVVDCGDPDCAAQCTEAGATCFDGVDNDHDGVIDCADPGCTETCLGHETSCNDGQDNDLDGLIDCADPDCPACTSVETQCADGLDDDGDGLVDCADPDCAGQCSSSCGDTVRQPAEQCDDGNLVDGDGCSATCQVEVASFCASVPALTLGGFSGTTLGATSAFSASCIPAGGPERAYRFVPPSDGMLYLTLDADTDLGLWVALGCGATSTQLACIDAIHAGGLETMGLAVPGGAPLTVYVDGASNGSAGAFTLAASFVATP